MQKYASTNTLDKSKSRVAPILPRKMPGSTPVAFAKTAPFGAIIFAAGDHSGMTLAKAHYCVTPFI